MTHQRTEMKLQDILFEFSLEKESPDANLVEDYVRRYPQYASEITAFAVELILESDLEPISESACGPDNMQSPMVTRVMSRFQNELYAIREAHKKNPGAADAKAFVGNPFLSLSTDSFRRLASKLKVSTLFLTRLRDRLIDHNTIPPRLIGMIAEELKTDFQIIAKHLAAPPEVHLRAQFYVAKEKPHVVGQQSFEDALRNSGLSDEQMSNLLKLKENE